MVKYYLVMTIPHKRKIKRSVYWVENSLISARARAVRDLSAPKSEIDRDIVYITTNPDRFIEDGVSGYVGRVYCFSPKLPMVWEGINTDKTKNVLLERNGRIMSDSKLVKLGLR